MAGEIEHFGGRAYVCLVDLRTDGTVEEFVEATADRWGHVDILVIDVDSVAALRTVRGVSVLSASKAGLVQLEFPRLAGHDIGRDQVARLIRQMGICGVSRIRRVRTTILGDRADRPFDLVKRDFTADRPNLLWVTDLERHEAPLNRVVMKGHHSGPVAAGTWKLRGNYSGVGPRGVWKVHHNPREL